MKTNKLINNNFFIIIFFIIIYSIGLFIYKDYGISFDENFHRENGSFWYKYAKNFFSDTRLGFDFLIREKIETGNFIETVPSIQPVPFVIISEFFLDLFNINENSKSIFQFGHLFNFSIYFIGLCFFYKLIFKRYKSNSYAFFGVLFLFITPRIFAESFYNQKDIFFLSMTIINMYVGINFLLNPSLKNSLIFSLSSALTIDTRIIGLISVFIIIFLFFLKALKDHNFLKNNLKSIFYFFPLTLIFVIIFWPYLWSAPIKNLIFSISELSKVSFDYSVLYFGKYILSTNIPWHYPFVWIGSTTPMSIVLLFLIGILFFLKRISSRILNLNNDKSDFWKGDNEVIDIYCLIIFLLPVIIYIKKGMGYDGWRHLYFIYPSIIMISLYGFYRIHLYLNNKFFKYTLMALILFNLFYLIFWNFKYHPHQNVYFNPFFKKNFYNNFEMDYWGLSNKTSLEYIINNNTKFPLTIGTKSFSSLEMSALILNESDKNKILITHNLNKAEYILSNYRPLIQRNFVIDKNKYKKYYDVIVDGVAINSVYKKHNP